MHVCRKSIQLILPRYEYIRWLLKNCIFDISKLFFYVEYVLIHVLKYNLFFSIQNLNLF